jgi:hypothetical protein
MEARDLARLARFSGANMVVITAKSAVLSDHVVEGVIENFFGPVLVVAEPPV